MKHSVRPRRLAAEARPPARGSPFLPGRRDPPRYPEAAFSAAAYTQRHAAAGPPVRGREEESNWYSSVLAATRQHLERMAMSYHKE